MSQVSEERSAPMFELGQVFGTAAVVASGIDLHEMIGRHVAGDWGDISDDDRSANEAALQYGGRLMSVYNLDVLTFWVITAEDRTHTTVLFPEEY